MRNALLGFLVLVLNALMSAPVWASDGHHGEEMRSGNGQWSLLPMTMASGVRTRFQPVSRPCGF